MGKRSLSSKRDRPSEAALLLEVEQALQGEKVLRLSLPGRGRLIVDQQVPFLCLYRKPYHGISALRRWVTGEVASLVVPPEPETLPLYQEVLRAVIAPLAARFGAFLLLQIQLREEGLQEPAADGKPSTASGVYEAITAHIHGELQQLRQFPSPKLQISGTAAHLQQPIVSVLSNELQKVSLMGRPTEVETHVCRSLSMLGLTSKEMKAMSCVGLTVELDHPYVLGARDVASWRELRPFLRGFMKAIKRTFFTFSRRYTPFDPPHYLALGRRALVKMVRRVDTELADVNRQFDFLLHITPVNAGAAWAEFRRKKYEQTPQFLYRPLRVEPPLLKRQLYNIPVEKIDDPSLAHLFLEKQEQLDRQITMLWDRNTPRFLFEGLQLYGAVPSNLLAQAQQLLEVIPARSRGESTRHLISPRDMAARAEEEIARYKKRWKGFDAKVFVRSDVAGILVSQGNLLIGEDAVIPASRREALVHHEVGTHCLTTANGEGQPLSLLGHGLAGYEGLQEGLAVLAEFLCGGLRRPRLRLLAGRVVAADSVIQGATFMETFRLLQQTHRFPRFVAFTIAMRVHRGGGFVKDMVYLQGLIRLLQYLGRGRDLEPLYVGKIGMSHAPLVRELLWRDVLQPPRLLPLFLETDLAKKRLEQVRQGLTVLDLARLIAKPDR